MYKYRVWCPDCWGDTYGCFEGSTESSEETYSTIEEADEEGYKCARQSVWAYEILDIKTGDVVKSYE